jgi:hypothetical protein
MADKKKEEPVTPEKKGEKKEKGDEKDQELVYKSYNNTTRHANLFFWK